MDPLLFALVVLLVGSSCSFLSPVASSANYSVGGTSGWLYNTTLDTAVIDYQAWADSNTFNLGDNLVFITSLKLTTVVQTYNNATYLNCDYSGSSSDDTKIHTDPIHDPKYPNVDFLVVELVETGLTGFFSSFDEPTQCQNGMRFYIIVHKGEGDLPPSPNDSSPPPPKAPSAKTPTTPETSPNTPPPPTPTTSTVDSSKTPPPPVAVTNLMSPKKSAGSGGPVTGVLVIAVVMMVGVFVVAS